MRLVMCSKPIGPRPLQKLVRNSWIRSRNTSEPSTLLTTRTISKKSSTSLTTSQRILNTVEERVRAELPAYLFDKMLDFHTRKGEKQYSICTCEYCSYKRYATQHIRWWYWRSRNKQREIVRQVLKELKEKG